MSAVEICAECDIADCRHIRARRSAETAKPKEPRMTEELNGGCLDEREAFPPLPEAQFIGTSRFGSIFRGHSDEAMRAYVAADRAARKPLTDEAIRDAIEFQFSQTGDWPEGDLEIARVIERAHGIGEASK